MRTYVQVLIVLCATLIFMTWIVSDHSIQIKKLSRTCKTMNMGTYTSEEVCQ